MARVTYRLSICIPTYNRDVYLESLLARMVDETAGLESRVEIVVSDNASTDDTPNVLAKFASHPQFKIVRRETNGGAERNFLNVIAAASGEYCWLYGDDEILLRGAVSTVLRILDERAPDLLYVSTEDQRFVAEPVEMKGLAEYVEYFAATKPRTILDVTLITTAIFRRASWERVADKERFIPTRYMHTLVLAEAMRDGGKIVVVPDAVIAVRAQRAAFADHGIRYELPYLHVNLLWALVRLTGSQKLADYARSERRSGLRRIARAFAKDTLRYVRDSGKMAGAALRCLFATKRRAKR